MANLLLIGLGLHLTRWSSWILWLEALGQPIWRWVAPLAQRTLTRLAAFSALSSAMTYVLARPPVSSPDELDSNESS